MGMPVHEKMMAYQRNDRALASNEKIDRKFFDGRLIKEPDQKSFSPIGHKPPTPDTKPYHGIGSRPLRIADEPQTKPFNFGKAVPSRAAEKEPEIMNHVQKEVVLNTNLNPATASIVTGPASILQQKQRLQSPIRHNGQSVVENYGNINRVPQAQRPPYASASVQNIYQENR